MARFFLASALLFGSVFIVIIPPFQVADEINHFFRAWQVSDGVFVGIRTLDNRLGGDLPISVVKITEPIFNNLSVPLDAQSRQFKDFSNTAIYAPTAYLPQVVAIGVGKLLNLGPLSIFYFSRLLTLIFWLSMVYAALKILPIKRDLLAALALLPSSLFINASASGDVVTNACSFLLIALFVKLIVEKKQLTHRQTFAYFTGIFATTLLISLNKLAYFPIIFLIFLIPKERFNGWKNKAIVATILIILNLSAMAFWSTTVKSLYIKYEDYNAAFVRGQELKEGVEPSLQMAFILHNPLTFSKIAILNLLKSFPRTVSHYVGKFGWEENYLPMPLIFILVLLVLIQAISTDKSIVDSKKGPLSINAKFGLWSVGTLMTFSFTATMYAIWNPVGGNGIANLMGKYFVPIYPLFFLGMPQFDLSKNRISRFLAQPKTFFRALLFVLIWSVFQVLRRYYIW
jgi:uncharacterized membrane protein